LYATAKWAIVLLTWWSRWLNFEDVAFPSLFRFRCCFAVVGYALCVTGPLLGARGPLGRGLLAPAVWRCGDQPRLVTRRPATLASLACRVSAVTKAGASRTRAVATCRMSSERVPRVEA
jgi:hypothetical protein